MYRSFVNNRCVHKNLNYTDVYSDFLVPSYVYGTCNVCVRYM